MRFLTIIIFFYLWFPVNAESFYTGKELLKHCENCVNSVNTTNINACVHCLSNISVMHDVFVAPNSDFLNVSKMHGNARGYVQNSPKVI